MSHSKGKTGSALATDAATAAVVKTHMSLIKRGSTLKLRQNTDKLQGWMTPVRRAEGKKTCNELAERKKTVNEDHWYMERDIRTVDAKKRGGLSLL